MAVSLHFLGGCEDSLSKVKQKTPPAYNATGTPDTGFGVNGFISYPSSIGGTFTDAVSIAVDSSDRLLISGDAETGAATVYDGAIWRLFSNGLVDPAFGVAGIAHQANMGASDGIKAVSADGANSVGVGQRFNGGNHLGVWRYFQNGVLRDPGVTEHTGTGGGTYGLAVHLDAAGGYFICGVDNSGTGLGLWHYLSDGSLDTAGFNPLSGFRSIALSGNDQCSGVTVDSSGRVVGAGTTTMGFLQLVVFRLNADGTTDTTFNSGGALPGFLVDPGAGSATEGTSILVLPGGQILVAGYTTVTSAPFDKNAAVWRLHSTGVLDSTFGTGGRVDLDGLNGTAGEDDVATGLALDSYGRILVAGYSGATKRMVLVRLNGDGSKDTSFATGGVYVDSSVTFNNNQGGAGVAVASTGQIFVAGSIGLPAASTMAVWAFK